jgi:Domain of unknown function (DUF4902)
MEPISTLGESIVACRDGYIRVSLKRLAILQFVHVTSACDKSLLAELLANAVPARAAGYTEWISKTTPFVSLGWDWYRDDVSRRCLLISNDVRSNIMLVDARGYDLGMHRTAHFVASWLGVLDWQAVVLEASFPDS